MTLPQVYRLWKYWSGLPHAHALGVDFKTLLGAVESAESMNSEVVRLEEFINHIPGGLLKPEMLSSIV